MNYLALDIGMRRTGCAFADDQTGIPLPLTTLHHTSVEELLTQLQSLIASRRIHHLVIGLPLLPDGSAGEQAAWVRGVADRLSSLGLSHTLLDERYSTDPLKPRGKGQSQDYDRDAAAACALLAIYLQRNAEKDLY